MNRKFLASLIFAAGSVFFVSAQNVNERELRSAGDASTIVFENYEGPHSVIETAAAISSIGAGLGNQLKNAGTQSSGTFGANGKYTVIHAVDPSEQGKLDADIILINPNATVDHIRNLRRIIASYLSAAYGYSQQDASTVATFVTVYNAVYRNQLDTFKSKYKNIVISNLTEKKCGLSIKWSDWPGNSQIVIPLGEYAEGGLSSVDTSVISDKKVVESMKEDDDKGVDERKNMVDIKEREAENAEAKAQEAAKEAAQDKQALDEQKKNQAQAEKKAQTKQNEADKAKKDAESAKKEAAADPQNKAKQAEAKQAEQKAENAQKEADQAKSNADQEQQKTQQQQQKADESAKKAEEQQQKADKKLDEAQNERMEIAKDQQEILESELKQLEDGTVIGLKVVKEADYLSTLVKVNSKTGKVVKESPVKVIRGRTIIAVQDAVVGVATGASFPKTSGDSIFYMAICGENSGKGAIKLCLIDAFKMEIQKESEENVSEHSVLVNNGSNFYCVIQDKSGWVLGRYDKSLNLIQKSAVNISESTPITVTGKGIVVTNSNNIPVLLSVSDLSVIEQ
ncbi:MULTISPECIES: P83/100 family protein [unclassified Treponema]|uniref:P83/100 family protein n=1 Tax=unclassified Treponema TaxID=2638727 RepID=UPI0025F7EF9C|nr:MULTISPECIES: P83/100 family protein [unclassified Treponema]